MQKSFKKRYKIIEDEIINEKWNRIYIEKQIRKIIQNRYKNNEIDLNSSYIYQKMAGLIDRKIYIEARWIPKSFVSSLWYINVFELHKKLEDIIKLYHLPNMKSKIYSKEEKEYMKMLMKTMRILG